MKIFYRYVDEPRNIIVGHDDAELLAQSRKAGFKTIPSSMWSQFGKYLDDNVNLTPFGFSLHENDENDKRHDQWHLMLGKQYEQYVAKGLAWIVPVEELKSLVTKSWCDTSSISRWVFVGEERELQQAVALIKLGYR